MVGRLTLDQEAEVRILHPQPEIVEDFQVNDGLLKICWQLQADLHVLREEAHSALT